MDVKTSFFDIMSELQTDLEDVSAGISNFFSYINPIKKNFVQNLRSKLGRSTLTSPGTIRVKAPRLHCINQHAYFPHPNTQPGLEHP
jgi:hypothetical protein